MISHRDLAPNNIYIHYHPRRSGFVPKVGLEGNAFPEVVVGDFGAAGQDGDDKINEGIFDTDEIHEWEDIYWLGHNLRQLCQTHIPSGGILDACKPEGNPMGGVNGRMGAGHTPYSNDLIQLLQNFEWPGCTVDDDATGTQTGADGLQHENWEWQPNAVWVRDTLLPLAQQKTAEYRNPPRAARVPGYYTRLDVSWTKPEELMPFEYDFKYAVAGDEVYGETKDEEEDDDNNEEEQEDDEEQEDNENEEEGGDEEDDEPDEPEHSAEATESNADENEDWEDEEEPVPDSDSSHHSVAPESQLRMQCLESLRIHHRDHGRPKFKVVTLHFNSPTFSAPNRQPPPLAPAGGGGGGGSGSGGGGGGGGGGDGGGGGGGGGDDDDDVEMEDAG